MAIFAINLKVNSNELFKNKNEEVNFIDNIHQMSYLVKKYYKDDKYEKLFQVFFEIQKYGEKITGKTLSIEEVIFLDFAKFFKNFGNFEDINLRK